MTERLIQRENIELLGIDPDDLRLDLHWSSQMVEMLPEKDPLREWHQKRLNHWGVIFKSIQRIEDKPISGTEDL